MSALLTQAELIRRITDEVQARLGATPRGQVRLEKSHGTALTVQARAEENGVCEIHCDASADRTLQRGYIPIGVSARHCHVTEAQVEILFGAGAKLEPMKPLRQPGQFASKQLVSVIGPRGRAIERIRILGPARNDTQLEISLTDCIYLGVDAPVRASGDHRDTPGILMVGPAGHLAMDRGVIRANRHVHLHTDEAAMLGLKDQDTVMLKIDGDRPAIYYDVQVRVRPDFRHELHLDTDDANAIGLGDGAVAQIITDLSKVHSCGCGG